MRIYEGSAELGGAARGCVLTVGNFDGVHLGHRSLLRAVLERGRALGRQAVVYTFDPHPRRVLSSDGSPPRLMTREQLAAELERFGIDILVRERFTREFASMTPEVFLADIIKARLESAAIYVGPDFHFGKGRSGSGETLRRLGPELGIQIEIVSQVRAGEADVSSTRIRNALASGDVAEAALCLGRPYSVWGLVVRGDERGRTLGFPTLNLDPDNELIPARGVYATTARFLDGEPQESDERPSVTNVGTRPTFESGRVLVETHLIDCEGDFYGRRVAVSFRERIRAERRFPGPEALKEQIARDVEAARRHLRARGGGSPARTAG